jgi:molybdopterin-guanine dinucleotide biosynthesis protein A
VSARAIVGIVLAGGASTRFGTDKLVAELDGRPLLHHAVLALAEVVDRVVVVVAPVSPDPSLPASLAGRVFVTRDAARHRGPLAGLAAGLGSDAAGPAEIALVVGGDMPWLMPAVLGLLVERLAADGSSVAMTLGASPPAPLPLALRVAGARDAVAALLAADRRSLRALLAAVPAATLPPGIWRRLDPDGRTLGDVDTPADLG